MNILIVTELYPAYGDHSPGDVNYAIHHFAREWAGTENVSVIRPFIYPDIRGRDKNIKEGVFELDGVTVHNIGIFKLFKLNMFKVSSLYRLADNIRFKPDVIVAHLGYGLYFGFLLSQKLKVPLVAGVHWGDFLYTPRMLSEKLLKEIFSHAVGVGCRSPVLKKKFDRKYPSLAEKSFEILSGISGRMIIEESRIKNKLSDQNQREGISFISVCSLIERKNIDVNLRALAGLDPAIDWTCTIVGDGPQRRDLEELAGRLKISGRVVFTGWLNEEQIRSELDRADVFILVSVRETFGLAYLEAMARGCLVVCTAGTGVDGIIRDGENGFVSSPDVEGLTGTIDRINRMDGEMKARMVRSGYRTVKEMTHAGTAGDYLNGIRNCLKN